MSEVLCSGMPVPSMLPCEPASMYGVLCSGIPAPPMLPCDPASLCGALNECAAPNEWAAEAEAAAEGTVSRLGAAVAVAAQGWFCAWPGLGTGAAGRGPGALLRLPAHSAVATASSYYLPAHAAAPASAAVAVASPAPLQPLLHSKQSDLPSHLQQPQVYGGLPQTHHHHHRHTASQPAPAQRLRVWHSSYPGAPPRNPAAAAARTPLTAGP
eukprot:1158392-Pelagomonas_calceolata.AAC.7